MTTSRKPLISALFGQYADSRLIHASLDPINADEIKSRCDFITRLPQGPDGAVWVDYVVDLGDGFDSTYAIAYLLGQKSLDIEGAGMLPRAGAHYGRRPGLSEATRDNYKKRMLNPYKFAFPDSEAPTRTPHTLVKFPGELMLRACQRPLWAKADIDRGFDGQCQSAKLGVNLGTSEVEEDPDRACFKIDLERPTPRPDQSERNPFLE